MSLKQGPEHQFVHIKILIFHNFSHLMDETFRLPTSQQAWLPLDTNLPQCHTAVGRTCV